MAVTANSLHSSSNIIKKVFFAFLPSHPHTCGWNALFIGVSSGEGKCEGKLSTLTIPHTSYPAGTSCLSGGSGEGKEKGR